MQQQDLFLKCKRLFSEALTGGGGSLLTLKVHQYVVFHL